MSSKFESIIFQLNLKKFDINHHFTGSLLFTETTETNRFFAHKTRWRRTERAFPLGNRHYSTHVFCFQTSSLRRLRRHALALSSSSPVSCPSFQLQFQSCLLPLLPHCKAKNSVTVLGQVECAISSPKTGSPQTRCIRKIHRKTSEFRERCCNTSIVKI